MQPDSQYSWGAKRCQPTLRQWVDSGRTQLRALLWPPTCLLCRQRCSRSLDLCEGCEADLPAARSACAVCAQGLPRADPDAELRCGACLLHPPPFQASFIPFRYAYPLDQLVLRLKFHGQLACGRVLGELFVRQLLAKRSLPLPPLMIPVPLSPRRYRERGYNQASELGRSISRSTGIALRTDLAVRVRDTLEQTALNRKARRRNLRGAFALLAPLPAQHVAILDDVVTTGSTAGELARVLQRAGARQVEVWAIARAGG